MATVREPGSGRRAAPRSTSTPRPRRQHPSGPQRSDSAQDDLDQSVADLDEDLAVEQELGLDPDDWTGEGGLETDAAGGPVIRDNRKIDPVSGRPRRGRHTSSAPSQTSRGNADGAGGRGTASDRQESPTPGTAQAAARALEDEVVAAAELIAAREELAIRTDDLQRVAAEYANYRKRVDRDRAMAGQQARADLLTALVPVLDDVDAARTAGELDGPFKAVAEKLESTLERFGMERYGAQGDAFDPTIHEALFHQTDPAVEEPRIAIVMQPGYRMDERVLRAARVGVVSQES